MSMLAPMTGMRDLSLRSRGFTGAIDLLGSMTEMRTLEVWMSGGVTGDIGGLRTMTKLEKLHIFRTSVGGDVAGLGPMMYQNFSTTLRCKARRSRATLPASLPCQR